MEFEGRIFKLLPLQTGVSEKTGNTWYRQELVFEYFEHPTDRFSDKAVLTLFNNHVQELGLKEDDKVRIGFGHNAREYNGKYYNELRVYKIEKIAPDNGMNGSNGNNGTNGNGDGEEKKSDDLPF